MAVEKNITGRQPVSNNIKGKSRENLEKGEERAASTTRSTLNLYAARVICFYLTFSVALAKNVEIE